MKKKYILLVLTLLTTILTCAAKTDPWNFQFDGRKWEVGFSHFPSSSKGGIEYVLSGESVTNWSELVTSQFATGLEGANLEQWLESFIHSMSERYTTFNWSRIPTDDKTLLFEWSHQGGDVWPAQHEIKRAIQIDDSLYFLAYVKKTKDLEKDVREQWIKILKEAKLTPINKDQEKQGNATEEGQLYEQAWALFKNGEKEKSLPVFLKAASSGDARAQYHLGMMYLLGDGAEKDLVESTKWFDLAAKQNNPYAQYQLGYAYFYGDGVKGDWDTGFAWFIIAAENGSNEAMEKCKKLKPLLKEADIQKSLVIRNALWGEIQDNMK